MKKIPVSDLKVGMCTINAGLPCSEHPFLYPHDEYIGSQEQIDLISNKGFTEVFVEAQEDAFFHCDEQLSITLDHQGESLESTASADPKRKSYLKELDRASQIYRDSLTLARQCIHDARLGNKPDVEQAETLIENIAHSISRNNDAIVSPLQAARF